MFEVGMEHVEKFIVNDASTAKALGSGGLEVFSTPSMIALMEKTCKILADSKLDESKGTVGISISTNHKAATPVGMEVRCECTIIEVDRNKLTFAVKCYDEVEEIGEGIHERFVIDNEKFLTKVNSKIDAFKNK